MCCEFKWKSSTQNKETTKSKVNTLKSSDNKRRMPFFQQNQISSFNMRNVIGSSGKVVQRVQFSDYTYSEEGQGTYAPFNEEQKQNIEAALQVAQDKLSNAENYLNEQLANQNVAYRAGLSLVKGAIRSVKGILQTDVLVIYPFLDNTSYGQSAASFNEISLNYSIHADISDLAKTLIHEAFHIIGGCTPGNPDNLDTGSLEASLSNIRRKKSIKTMQADSFAQFVMQC